MPPLLIRLGARKAGRENWENGNVSSRAETNKQTKKSLLMSTCSLTPFLVRVIKEGQSSPSDVGVGGRFSVCHFRLSIGCLMKQLRVVLFTPSGLKQTEGGIISSFHNDELFYVNTSKVIIILTGGYWQY